MSEIVEVNQDVPVLTYCKIEYFKASGKFYAGSQLDLLPTEIKSLSNGKYFVYMDEVKERVIELSMKKQLPDINSNWLDNGYIYIDHEDGYPCLIIL